jgi:hypothetical protein
MKNEIFFKERMLVYIIISRLESETPGSDIGYSSSELLQNVSRKTVDDCAQECCKRSRYSESLGGDMICAYVVDESEEGK